MRDHGYRLLVAHAKSFGDRRFKAAYVAMALLATFVSAVIIGMWASSGRQAARGYRTPADICQEVRPSPIVTDRSLANRLPNCTSTFLKYHPSPWEQSWVDTIGSIQSDDPDWAEGCRKVASERENILSFFNELSRNDHSYCKGDGTNEDLPRQLFSAIGVSEKCMMGPEKFARMKHNHSIEPLVSFLRDPRALCSLKGRAEYDRQAQDSIYSKENLILAQPPCDGVARQGRRLLFLIGAKPTLGSIHSGHGQRWLIEQYSVRGLPFDALYVWESGAVDSGLFWEGIPERLRPLTHLYNVPYSTEPDASLNPLRVLLAVAQVEDFVVMKIDSDEPAIEETYVQHILDSEAISSLIDEFFWEHIVRGSPMQWHGWGDASSKTRKSLQGSYQLLTGLRERGIRAHSWAT